MIIISALLFSGFAIDILACIIAGICTQKMLHNMVS